MRSHVLCASKTVSVSSFVACGRMVASVTIYMCQEEIVLKTNGAWH